MSLAPEHFADLQRSGLSDEVIQTLEFESVRPHDLKIPGAKSAYRIPYFELDGKRNCFERWRLFPVVVRTDGGKQKYHQPPGSDPSLYLPPLFPWKTVARQPASPILFVEGEKKAAAGCAKGLFAIGVGGLWNWRQRLGTGEPLVIPTIDQFQWAGREVLLVPDSDAWRMGRELDLLAGFYAFGQELISRRASVDLLRLPDQDGRKAGLDDWLVAVGGEWDSLWPRLERLGLDDDRLKTVAAWWQSWRGKQATEEFFKSPEAEKMDILEIGGRYSVAFPAYRVRFQFDRLADARGGVQAEMTAHIANTELLGETDINLKSDGARGKIASSLKNKHASLAGIPWKLLLERGCTAVLKRHRCGEPVVQLTPNESMHVPFAINPVIYSPFQTLMYAPGGSLKSYLALYLALLACHGTSQNGFAAVQCPVLYLDWELDETTVGKRLKLLRAGHPELSRVTPFYRRCELPLHHEANQIAAHVAELGVRLLIIDSAAMACGGDLNTPDAAIKLQRGLRTIKCASLMLAHVSKAVADGQERSAYGTVFFRELARNVWELERVSDPERPARIVLVQKKNNFGPLRQPMALEFQFPEDATRVIACDPNDEPELDAKLPLAARIRNLLEDGNVRSAQEIADELDASLNSVKVTLSRHKGTKWHQLGENKEARWACLNR
jgi:hypothetical protein